MTIPQDFLESCIDVEQECAKDTDTITENIVWDMPDLGEEVNTMIYKAIFEIVDKHVMPEVDEFLDGYFEPSPLEEAMADIRAETIRSVRNANYRD